MTILTLLMGLWFTAYPLLILKRYGKLTSISASTYNLMQEGKNDKWLFWFWLVVLAGMNLGQGLEVWGWLSSVGLIFTGMTVNHAGSFKAENTLHTIAAFTAIIAGAVGMLVVYSMLFPLVIIGICALVLLGNKYYIWDMEMIAFYTLLFALLIK